MKRIISLFILSVLFSGTAYAGTSTLTWDANTETDLAGYKVYFGNESGSYGTPIDVGMTANPLAPSFVHEVAGPDCGENIMLFYAVTAYDTQGQESAFSVEQTKVFDLPPCAPVLHEILATLKRIESLMMSARINFGE